MSGAVASGTQSLTAKLRHRRDLPPGSFPCYVSIGDNVPVTVLLLGGRAGVISTLAVTLSRFVPVGVTWNLGVALRMLERCRPDVILIEAGQLDSGTLAMSSAIRARAANTGLVLTVAKHDPAIREALVAGSVDRFCTPLPGVGTLRRHVAELLRLRRVRHNRLPTWGHYVARAWEYLGDHCHERIRLERLAATTGLSASHLAHLFRLETDLTVTHAVAGIRVLMASYVLSVAPDKLEAIAEEVGFCDAAHLSRTFTRVTGWHPGAFRQYVRQRGTPPDWENGEHLPAGDQWLRSQISATVPGQDRRLPTSTAGRPAGLRDGATRGT